MYYGSSKLLKLVDALSDEKQSFSEGPFPSKLKIGLLDSLAWRKYDVLFIPSISCTPPKPSSRYQVGVGEEGHKTELVLCSYEDHFLIVASQIGAFGTILHARKEEGVTVEPTFSVSVVFGKRDEPMMVACARQLIENISKSASPKPLVLSLGLKDHSLETVKGIVSAVIENCLW